MTELVLAKTAGGALVPVDPDSAAFVAKLKVGAGVRGKFKRQRNLKFHRKAFALLWFAFDMWDAPQLEYQGQRVAKNFDRFRKDVTILAGFYTAVTNFRGEVRLEALSLSFDAMGDDEFERVYKAILGVVWERVLRAKGYDSPEKVQAIVDELLRFE